MASFIRSIGFQTTSSSCSDPIQKIETSSPLTQIYKAATYDVKKEEAVRQERNRQFEAKWEQFKK